VRASLVRQCDSSAIMIVLVLTSYRSEEFCLIVFIVLILSSVYYDMSLPQSTYSVKSFIQYFIYMHTYSAHCTLCHLLCAQIIPLLFVLYVLCCTQYNKQYVLYYVLYVCPTCSTEYYIKKLYSVLSIQYIYNKLCTLCTLLCALSYYHMICVLNIQ